ncbi:MAG: hypothetical protein EPN86_03830 [Nanoarchaeota archaeon]|nr:MAG: hypothetical protein EPN86_03830 [Nanoarchaeota archaeon]
MFKRKHLTDLQLEGLVVYNAAREEGVDIIGAYEDLQKYFQRGVRDKNARGEALRHLSGCGDCNARYGERRKKYSDIVRDLYGANKFDPPPDLHSRILRERILPYERAQR